MERRDASPRELVRDPTQLTQYLRCLGETGDPERLLAVLQQHLRTLERMPLVSGRCVAYLFAFAFGGRTAATARVLDTMRASVSAGAREFWMATAEAAAGEHAKARARFEAIARQDDAQLRASALSRMAHPPAVATALSVAGTQILAELEQRFSHEERYAERTSGSGPKPFATYALIAINVAMFVIEILAGGSEDGRTLYRLGAVFTPVFAPSDAWRLLASTFLHFGALHLAMNMLGLLVLGPYLERALGAVRYVAVYLCAGIVGSLAVVVVDAALDREVLMVGASGSILGLIGGTAAVLLRGWRAERARPALGRLRGVVTMLAVQVIFDVLTPNVSSTAHFAGLVAGFVVCALLRHWQPSDAAGVPGRT